jgi:hypothetical protein
MKTFQTISITLVGAVALIISASTTRADPSPSDQMFLYNNVGSLQESAVAFEADEIAKQAATGLPLYNFNSFASTTAVGNFIRIVDAEGVTSDVIGVILVPSINGLLVPNFAFLSGANEAGLTDAQIVLAGFNLAGQQGAPLVEDPLTGIFLDSATNPIMLSFIDLTRDPGGRLTFFSDGVPDGGSAVALLGIALAGIEGLRRMIGARKA